MMFQGILGVRAQTGETTLTSRDGFSLAVDVFVQSISSLHNCHTFICAMSPLRTRCRLLALLPSRTTSLSLWFPLNQREALRHQWCSLNN